MGRRQLEIENLYSFSGRVAHNVRRLRRAKRWSIQDAAEKIGMSKPHYYKIEAGKHPMAAGQYLDQIANAFGVDITVLVRRPKGLEKKRDR